MTGRDLHHWRESRALSQREASKALGITTRSVQLAEAAPDEPLGPKLRRRLSGRLALELADEAAGAAKSVGSIVPAELIEALERADTAEELLDFERRVALASAQKKLDLRRAAFLIDACREMRQTLVAREQEKAQSAFARLEIMTLDEAADLAALRASKVPKSLAPGEAPPLPDASP